MANSVDYEQTQHSVASDWVNTVCWCLHVQIRKAVIVLIWFCVSVTQYTNTFVAIEIWCQISISNYMIYVRIPGVNAVNINPEYLAQVTVSRTWSWCLYTVLRGLLEAVSYTTLHFELLNFTSYLVSYAESLFRSFWRIALSFPLSTVRYKAMASANRRTRSRPHYAGR